MLIMSIMSAAASVKAQSDSVDYQKKVNATQTDNSLLARSDNANQVNLQRGQATEGAVQKIHDNNVAAAEAQGTVLAGGGPGGISMDAILGNLGARQGGYNASVVQNLDRTNSALDSQLTNVNRQAASEIASERAPGKVDYLGAALRIGQAYVGYQGTQVQGSRSNIPNASLKPSPRDY
jgi:hypothetical protein